MSSKSISNTTLTIAGIAAISLVFVSFYKYNASKREKSAGQNDFNGADMNSINFENVGEETLLDVFRNAAKLASTLSNSSISEKDRMMLYGLYKQASLGDRNIEAPSKLNLIAHAKYIAWGKFTGLPKKFAMVKYIEVVQHFSGMSPSQEENSQSGTLDMLGDFNDNSDIIYENDNGEESSVDSQEDEKEEPAALSSLGKRQSTLTVIQNLDDQQRYNESNGEALSAEGGEAHHMTPRNAARLGNVSCLRSALKLGLDVNDVDESGQTALHFAADKGNIDCVTTLVDAGADINAADKDGISVLQAAVIGGDVETVRALLLAGADPNQEDNDGDTPRSCAEDDDSDEMTALFQELT